MLAGENGLLMPTLDIGSSVFATEYDPGCIEGKNGGDRDAGGSPEAPGPKPAAAAAAAWRKNRSIILDDCSLVLWGMQCENAEGKLGGITPLGIVGDTEGRPDADEEFRKLFGGVDDEAERASDDVDGDL